MNMCVVPMFFNTFDSCAQDGNICCLEWRRPADSSNFASRASGLFGDRPMAGFGVLKKCCALYSMSKGKLNKDVGEAIVKAADEVCLISMLPVRGCRFLSNRALVVIFCALVEIFSHRSPCRVSDGSRF